MFAAHFAASHVHSFWHYVGVHRLWAIFAILVVWGVIAPLTLGPVYRTWMRIGMLIGKVTTPVILTLVFVISIIPTSLVLRIIGKDMMRRKFDDSPSYRVESKEPSVENMEKPY